MIFLFYILVFKRKEILSKTLVYSTYKNVQDKSKNLKNERINGSKTHPDHLSDYRLRQFSLKRKPIAAGFHQDCLNDTICFY